MDWNYIAGFFDGEGSLTQHKNNFRISIPQTNEEVLQLIQKFTGYGHIVRVTKRKKHWKDSWLYYIAKKKNVLHFVTEIKKGAIVKRQIINAALPKIKIGLSQQLQNKALSQRRIQESKKLRKKGLSYRAIGKKLKIDWGHARRLILKQN